MTAPATTSHPSALWARIKSRLYIFPFTSTIDIHTPAIHGVTMQRSTGITISAILVFVGSGFTLLPAFVAAFLAAFAHTSRASHFLPKPLLWVGAIVYLGLATWGIATGVGLLRLREWSRVSQLIFSALLVLAVVGAMMLPFINFPVSPNDPDPEFTRRVMSSMKIGIAGFYGVLASLGAWWLYYFNKGSVRAQFRSAQFQAAPVLGVALPESVHPTPPHSFIVPPPAATSPRPVSISVVAVLLLVGSAILPVHMIIGTPVLLFGFLLSGAPAVLLAVLTCAANAAAGIGLFKLKLWARNLAIGLVLFAMLNILLTVFMPGSQSRWDQAMQTISEKWGTPSTTPPPHIPLWLTMLSSVPVVFLELYFLITRKPAFSTQPQNHPPAQ